MKKQINNVFLVASILTFGIVSCKKENQPNDATLDRSSNPIQITTANNFYSAKEVNFKPNEQSAIISLTERFIEHTSYNMTTNKTSLEDLLDQEVNAGSWLFEAASNYLSNSNNLQSESEEVTYSFTIDKNLTGEMKATDLLSTFNSFIYNIESYRASEGYKPKVIDVRIGNETLNDVVLVATVTYGLALPNNPVGYTFPTNVVSAIDAAQIYLTNSVSTSIRQLNTSYLQVVGSSGSLPTSTYFLSSVTSYNSIWISQDFTNGNYFYFGSPTSYQPFLFVPEHDLLVAEVLNYCSLNSIPTTKLWSSKIGYQTLSGQVIIHELKQIKTADVNVM